MKKTMTRMAAFCTVSSFLLAGCATAPAEDHVEGQPAHWGYEGAGAPERWGSLDPAFAVCETGTRQSPIDLVNATRADLPDLSFDYDAAPLHIENKGHTVQVNYPAGSTIDVGGTRYELLQFHFHTPAEHRIAGRELPAELHLVHRSASGELAVVGVMIERGAHNTALAGVWQHLPRNTGEEHHMPSVRVDAGQLLPASRERYSYPGSLTTPPCSEGVRWMVLQQPIQMSDSQIQALHSIIRTSNRPVQPLGARDLRIGM